MEVSIGGIDFTNNNQLVCPSSDNGTGDQSDMSWFVRDPYSPLGKVYMAIIRFTEPMVEPCRRLLDRMNLNTGMFDFSVLLAFFMIEIIATLAMSVVAAIF